MKFVVTFQLLCVQLLGISLNIRIRPAATQDCGILNEQHIYNRTHVTAIESFPWTALINYRSNNKRHDFICQGVLISKRLVFTTNFCVSTYDGIELDEVVLGDNNPASARDCNDDGECADSPQVYGVEEIILNPGFDKRKRTGDVGMLRLDRDVVFTRYIRPLCLPPAAQRQLSQDALVTRFLHVAGYLRRIELQLQPKKKSLVQIVSPGHCQNIYKSVLHIESEHICGLIEDQLQLISGAALMDIHVEDNQPKYFYLIGVLSFSPRNPRSTVPDIFTSVMSKLDWIQRNIDLS